MNQMADRNTVICRNCKRTCSEEDEFCPQCHFRIQPARPERNIPPAPKLAVFERTDELTNVLRELESSLKYTKDDKI